MAGHGDMSGLLLHLKYNHMCINIDANFFRIRKMSCHRQELVCTYIGIPGSFANNISHFAISLSIVFCIEKKSQHDDDDESGISPSMSTARKSTILSEVSYSVLPLN